MALSAPAAIQSLRREIERAGSDPDRDPAERVTQLRRLRRDLDTLRGQADSYLGDNELRREAANVERQRGLTAARVAADGRDDVIAEGRATTEEMEAAGWPSHDEIDLALENGQLEDLLRRPWRDLQEAVRGAARKVSAPGPRRIYRLPDGSFAPKGQGNVLIRGERVKVDHPPRPDAPATGRVTVGHADKEHGDEARVKLDDGTELTSPPPEAAKSAEQPVEKPKAPPAAAKPEQPQAEPKKTQPPPAKPDPSEPAKPAPKESPAVASPAPEPLSDEPPNALSDMPVGEAMTVGDGAVYRTKEGFVAEHAGQQIKTKSHREAAHFAVLGHAKTTRDKHSHVIGKDENGNEIRRYSQERREWAKKRLDMSLRQRKEVTDAKGKKTMVLCEDCPYLEPQEQAEILFLAGGPASGKSSQAAKFGPKIEHAALVDPDENKMASPEFQALAAINEETAGDIAHHEAADMAKALREEAISRGLNMVVDGTGNSGKKQFASKLVDAKSRKLPPLKEGGEARSYKVHVFMVTIPTDEAVKRADLRAAKTGRAVDHSGGRTMHRNVTARFMEDVVPILPELDSVQVWDNHQGQAEDGSFNPARRIAYAGPEDSELVRDPGTDKEWASFVEKLQQPEEVDISDPSYV